MSAVPVHAPVPAVPARTRHLRVVTDADLRRAEQEFESRERALRAAARWAARREQPEAVQRASVPGAVEAPMVLTARGRAAARMALAVAAVLVAIAVGSVIGSLFSAAPLVGESITVGAGDTLWSIAAAELPGADVRDSVAQIMSLNELGSSTIHAGQVLVLPAH